MSTENLDKSRSKSLNVVRRVFGKLSKKLSLSNVFINDFNKDKNRLDVDVELHSSNLDHSTAISSSKSQDNLDFIRYINDFSNSKVENCVSNHWEILSQIQHTPKQMNNYHHLNHINKQKEYNIHSKSNIIPEKLNVLLDFVMSQILKSSTDKNLTKSIDNIVAECCFDKLLSISKVVIESLSKSLSCSKNTNYLKVMFSPECQTSDSEVNNNNNTQDTINNNFRHIKSKNEHRISTCRKKGLTCVNQSARYAGISGYNRHRLSRKPPVDIVQYKKENYSLDKKMNEEYICYISAKKAVKNKPIVSLNNSEDPIAKSSMDIAQNVEDKKLETTYRYKSVNKDIKTSRKEANNITKNPVVKKSKNKFQITKAAYIECSDDRSCNEISNSNIKLFNLKHLEGATVNDNCKATKNKECKIGPITHIFAGEESQLGRVKKYPQIKSVVSNMRGDVATIIPSNRGDISCSMKSTSSCNYYSKVNQIPATHSYYLMRNNNNDNQQSFYPNLIVNCDDNSETELLNTESSLVNYHAVKAKYLDQSKLVRLDPRPEDIKVIYDKVMQQLGTFDDNDNDNNSLSNNCDLMADPQKSLVTGQTFSCDEDNHLIALQRPNSSEVLADSRYCSSESLDQEEGEEENKSYKMDSKALQLTKSYSSIVGNQNIELMPSNSIIDIPSEDPLNSNLSRNISAGCVTNIYYRNQVASNSNLHKLRSHTNNSNKFQANISENLLKHTFASQQKIRMKH